MALKLIFGHWESLFMSLLRWVLYSNKFFILLYILIYSLMLLYILIYSCELVEVGLPQVQLYKR